MHAHNHHVNNTPCMSDPAAGLQATQPLRPYRWDVVTLACSRRYTVHGQSVSAERCSKAKNTNNNNNDNKQHHPGWSIRHRTCVAVAILCGGCHFTGHDKQSRQPTTQPDVQHATQEG